MQTLKNTPELLTLRGEVSESLANAIRRSISEVPTLAIDEVEIYKNDSALYDEVLAHRVGLIPIKTEKSMNSKTKVDFKLSVKGPATVYSGDLVGAADIPFPKMPITLIKENHKVELIATATLGTGLEHAKYVPGLFYYRHVLEVKSSPKIDPIIQASKGVFAPEKKGSSWICDLREADLHKVEELDSNAVSDTKELLLFTESYGNMPAKDLFTAASKALSTNLEAFEKAIK
tara:strand:+ start:493 stop:1188 length:696 start_codon:yes stop_codon:yes gene_type:complete